MAASRATRRLLVNIHMLQPSFLWRNSAIPFQRWNSNRASIAQTNRKVYPRAYPTVVVNPDGSSYRIKYHEPRKILYLPFDVNSLTLEEKKARLARYQVKKKQVIKDDLEDSFDTRKYQQFWKTKRAK